MRRWLPLRLAVVAVVVGVAVLVALLVRSSGEVVLHTYRGLPAGVEADLTGAEPGWLLAPESGRIAVYAAGSSSCPWLPQDVVAEGDRVTITLGTGTGECTADLTWTTSVVAVPDGVDLARLDVDLVLDG